MGAFSELLASAKAAGVKRIQFEVDLDASDEDPGRWIAIRRGQTGGRGSGRTGEEALRRLVEALRT